MRKVLLAMAAYATMFVPAYAETIDITFNDWKAAGSVTIGDKEFTYIGGGNNFGNAEVIFTSTSLGSQTIYDMDIMFASPLNNTTIDLDYSVTVTDPLSEITGLGVSSQILAIGTDFDLTKTYYSSAGHVGQIGQLVSVNGGTAETTGNFGQLVYTHVTATVPAGNIISSFRDEYAQTSSDVPEPSSIALLGLGAVGLAFGAYRKRRRTTLAA